MGTAESRTHMDPHGNRATSKPGDHSASGSPENLPNSQLEGQPSPHCSSQCAPGNRLEMQVLEHHPEGVRGLGMMLRSLCSTSWGAREPGHILPQRATIPSQSRLRFTAGPHLDRTPVRKTACICPHCANLILKAYFHPEPHLTRRAATRERQTGHRVSYSADEKRRPCELEVQAGPEQKVGPQAASAQPPESPLHFTQSPSVHSKSHAHSQQGLPDPRRVVIPPWLSMHPSSSTRLPSTAAA